MKMIFLKFFFSLIYTFKYPNLAENHLKNLTPQSSWSLFFPSLALAGRLGNPSPWRYTVSGDHSLAGNVECALSNRQWWLCSVQPAVCSIYAVCIKHYYICSLCYAVCSLQFTVCSVQGVVFSFSVPCSLQCSVFTVYSLHCVECSFTV